MEVNTMFAHRLKELREVSGLSQTQLAEKLGVSRGSISFYENGERVPDINFLDKVSIFFGGIPVDYLLGYSKNKKEEYAEIGSLTGLSDKAIDNLKEAFYETDILSYMIESEEFGVLMRTIERFLEKATHQNKEYLEFEISKLFISVLEIVRAKKYFKNRFGADYDKLSEEEQRKVIKEIADSHNEFSKRYNELKNKINEEFRNNIERDEQLIAENSETRKKVLNYLKDKGAIK